MGSNITTTNELQKLMNSILVAAKEVHTELGTGFAEDVYKEAMHKELTLQGIQSIQKFQIGITYKEMRLEKWYIADLCVNDMILVEIKTVNEAIKIDETQMTNYLRAANLRAGLILNFGYHLSAKRRILLEPITGDPVTPVPPTTEEPPGE